MKNQNNFALWYKLARDKLIKKYKNDYVLMGGLIASTSPRYQVKRNINTSKNIYNDYIKNRKKFFNYAINNRKSFLKKYKLLPCHYNNILRVLLKDIKQDKNSIILGGLKVNSFYHNIIEKNDIYVTIDIWMLRYFKHQKNHVTIKEYKKYTRIIVKYAKKQNRKPKECQALIWEKIRKKSGYRSKYLHTLI